MRLRSLPSEMASARAEARQRALAGGLDPESAEAFASAVYEAATNAMEHGNQSQPDRWVTLEFQETSDSITATVRDEGPGISPKALGAEDLGERGRGLRLMQALVDEIHLGEGVGEVVLVKRKQGRAKPS